MKNYFHMVEFRGISTHVGKDGKTGYRGHFEDEDFEAFSLYLGQDIGNLVSFKKTDILDLVCDFNQAYKYHTILEARLHE